MDQLKAIFAVKLKLALRSGARRPFETTLQIVAVLFLIFILIFITFMLSMVYRQAEPDISGHFFPAMHWILGILWFIFPFSPLAVNQNLNFEGLALLPIRRFVFVGALIVNSLASISGVIVPLLIVSTCIIFGNTPETFAAALVLSLLFWAAQLVMVQIMLLLFGRILASRRFADIAIVLSTCIAFLFYMSRFLFISDTVNGDSFERYSQALAPLKPIFGLFPPSLAGAAFNSVAKGDFGAAALPFAILLVELVLILLGAGWAVAKFFTGELSLGGTVRKRRDVAHHAIDASQPRRQSAFDGIAAALGVNPATRALALREWRYLAREPVYKLRLMNSMFVFVYLFGMYFMMSTGRAGFDPRYVNYLLPFFAYISIATEFKLAANKFGMDGEAISTLFLTPVNRSDVMLAKTIFSISVFQGINIIAMTAGAILMHLDPILIPLFLVSMIVGALAYEACGNVIGVYFPYRIVSRSGRRGMPQFEQGGCTFQLVYGAANMVSTAISLPLAAMPILPYYFGYPALGFALIPIALTAAVLLLRYSMRMASELLAQREFAIIELLTKGEG